MPCAGSPACRQAFRNSIPLTPWFRNAGTQGTVPSFPNFLVRVILPVPAQDALMAQPKSMRLHNIVRILFYSVVAIFVAAVGILGVTIYLRGIRVPASVLNARAAQNVASRYGVRYNLESLQIGCLGRNCPREVNAGAMDIEIQISEPLRIHLGETHSSRESPVTARGLEIRSGNRPPIIVVDSVQTNLFNRQANVNGLHIGLLSTVGSVEFDGAAKQVTAAGIRFSSVGVDTIQLQGWSSAPDNFIALNRVDVSGVHVSPSEGTAANTICAQLPSSADMGADAITPF